MKINFILILFCLFVISSYCTGGYSSEKEADENIKQISAQVRLPAEDYFGKRFENFEPLTYSYQIVEGVNFKINIKINDKQFITVKVYKPLDVDNTAVELKHIDNNVYNIAD
jgi:hypothetical protein